MRGLFWIAVIFFVSGCAVMSSKEMQPMFGGNHRRLSEKPVHAEFIQQHVNEYGTQKAASIAVAQTGWANMKKGQLNIAMKRFNQAWLLDTTNYHAYWGFAQILHQYGDKKKFFHIQKAHQLAPHIQEILLDQGMYHGLEGFKKMSFNSIKLAARQLSQSEAAFQKAAKINSNNCELYIRWAEALYINKQAQRAASIISQGEYSCAVARQDEQVRFDGLKSDILSGKSAHPAL